MMSGQSTRGSYLLVPAMPTPNGPLHLGHVSGPYLKMDVMARALRRAGHGVALVSASDSWEMHVLPRALREGRSAEEVCATYHAAIENCFDELNIRFDSFFNPLDADHRDAAEAVYRDLYQGMPADGPLAGITLRDERIPYSLPHRQPVLGSHIAGQCPHCGVPDLGGFYCEDCGFEISPGDILGYWSELPDDAPEWRNYTSAFIRIADVGGFAHQIRQRCRDEAFTRLALASLAFNGSATRLTHPAQWGVELKDARLSSGSVFFSYPGMYALSILCGEQAKPVLGLTENPFAKTSGVTLVKSFGFDNTAPYLLAATALGLTSPRWRAFDHYLTNHFATLEGAKFSTSGNHAIWANEARHRFGTASDTLRAYLCLMNPQYRRSDFSEAGFAPFKRSWEQRLRDLVHAKDTAAMEPGDHRELVMLMNRQQRLLEPQSFDLGQAFATLEAFLAHAERRRPRGGGPGWALGFATLAYPFLPGLAKTLVDRAGADTPLLASLPDGLPGGEELRSAYLHILTSPAPAIIKGGHSGGHRPEYL